MQGHVWTSPWSGAAVKARIKGQRKTRLLAAETQPETWGLSCTRWDDEAGNIFFPESLIKRTRPAALNKYTYYHHQKSRRAEPTAVTSTLGVYLSPLYLLGWLGAYGRRRAAAWPVRPCQRARMLLHESVQAWKGRPRNNPAQHNG